MGEFQKEALAGLAAPGTRLGILPHGVLARVLGEELAFLDPPGDDGVTWRLRPLTRRTELEDVPLEARIDVLIQSPNGGARAMEWPGGAPERGDVVTFEIEAEDKDGPTILVLSARGSASLRAERAVVTAPDDWSVRWEDQTAGGVPGRIGKTLDGRALWLVDKSVLVESTDGSFLYRIQTGADQDLRDYIALNDVVPQSMESADDFPLYTEQLSVICYRGLTPTKVSSSELLWRQYRGDKWRELAHRIRYALYNGEMPEDDKAARERTIPEQVLCRRTLRSNPPPILVTNVTMLEYLTMRKKDRPILEASQGKLRWIILDEAHSYTGSNAAEIALLLRRVLVSFGATPDQVRFVATSATIGEGTPGSCRPDFRSSISGDRSTYAHTWPPV